MKRIMVIGCCGSGKSTLSLKIQRITGLPLFHLDQYYWQPNWSEPSKEKWEKIVADLANKEEWIIDGNYGGTMDLLAVGRLHHLSGHFYHKMPWSGHRSRMEIPWQSQTRHARRLQGKI
jgi:hypothetical protein